MVYVYVYVHVYVYIGASKTNHRYVSNTSHPCGEQLPREGLIHGITRFKAIAARMMMRTTANDL